MDFKKLVEDARSVRRYDESRAVSMVELTQLSDMARLTASAGNFQPLRHMLVNDADMREAVFGCLGWAGYLPTWPGPDEGQRPAAYIILCSAPENADHAQVDAGIQGQTIMLGARSMGLGCCMLGSVNREKLAQALSLPSDHAIVYVMALGAPAEEVVIEELASGGSIKYWRDADDAHHVPKRSGAETVIGRFGT